MAPTAEPTGSGNSVICRCANAGAAPLATAISPTKMATTTGRQDVKRILVFILRPNSIREDCGRFLAIRCPVTARNVLLLVGDAERKSEDALP
jgi:hypothetical protein